MEELFQINSPYVSGLLLVTRQNFLSTGQLEKYKHAGYINHGDMPEIDT